MTTRPASPVFAPTAQGLAPHDYRVRLESFEGPLDLLLFLVRKNEVDITDIPIARITDQYLAVVGQLLTQGSARLDIDDAGEFLVMAATLTEIKSRMLMPRQGAPEGAAPGPGEPAPVQEDPRAELVRQLMEYKRYRDAADTLERRGDEWSRRSGIRPAGVEDNALGALLEERLALQEDLSLDELSLYDLVEAFRKIEATVNFERLGEHQVTYDDTPIEVHAAELVARLEECRTQRNAGEDDDLLPLGEVFVGRTRAEMIGKFLAILELARHGKLGVRQRDDGQVWLRLREPTAPEAAPPTPAGESTVAS